MEGNVSVTLTPTCFVLRGRNGMLYGPFPTIEVANTVKIKLGDHADPNTEPEGVLRTTIQGQRGRKRNASKVSVEASPNGETEIGVTGPETSTGTDPATKVRVR